jgi:SAM-dependent methyltransferase
MTSISPTRMYADPEHLLAHSYGTVDDYKVRSEGWEAYNRNPVTLVDWALGRLELEPGIAVLDAGAGLGRFALAIAERVPDARVVALDVSAAMVDAVRAEAARRALAVEATIASIEDLPLDAGQLDLVLCNYVLYHAGSIPRAIDELARVLRPGGTLSSIAPCCRWLPELIDWQDRALLGLGIDYDDARITPTGTNRFCSDNAPAYLARRFRIVRAPVYDGTMSFPSVDVLWHHYLHTMRFKNIVAAGVDGERLASAVRALMAQTLAETGQLRVTSISTCFVCTREA